MEFGHDIMGYRMTYKFSIFKGHRFVKCLALSLKGYRGENLLIQPAFQLAMPLSGLRGVIFTFLLLSFSKRYSPNCANATPSLPTNEKKHGVLPQRQNYLKDWQKKLAVIIHRLPGLLTKPVDQPVKLLNHRGAKKKNGMKRKGNQPVCYLERMVR